MATGLRELKTVLNSGAIIQRGAICVNERTATFSDFEASGANSINLQRWTGLRSKQQLCKNFRPAIRCWRGKGQFRGPVSMDIPDFLPATWTKGRERPPGPSFEYTAEDAVLRQLDALQANDWPYPDHGVEVMYRFAGFDPFERSTYFGPRFDLGQFERFRRIFHHSSYRVLLGHSDRKVLSSFNLNELLGVVSKPEGPTGVVKILRELFNRVDKKHCFKQRIWVSGARPGEEETFEFTLVQRVGGSWDGYWLTDSVIHDGDGLRSGIAY